MKKTTDNSSRRGLRTSYVSTIIGISLVLFMIGLVLGGYLGLDSVQKQARESVSADIFFKPELNDADIKQIEQELNTWNEFSDVTFVSEDRALEELFSLDRKQELREWYEGEQIIPTSITYQPKESFATVEGMKQLKAKILQSYGDRIVEIHYQEENVQDVNLGFKQFVVLFGAVATLLIIIAVAMINNTIRLALYSKRFSIKTMQLVGATSGYIRRPFLWQAIGMGIISGVIGMAILLVLFFAIENVLTTFQIPLDLNRFALLFAVLVTTGIIITVISTWFALNKYLRMKLDDLY
jgi:cell division transport system permease protein